MLRFYEGFGAKVLMALLYAKDRCGDDITYSEDHARGQYTEYGTGNTEVVEVVRETMDREPDREYMTLTSLIDPIAKQIRSGMNRTAHDKDLIDTIVRTLQLGYVRNKFSSDMIRQLKNAILLPSELVGLKAKLKKEELTCSNCEHVFVNGEMSSVVMNDRDQTPGLYCVRCFKPERVACQKRTHAVNVPKSLWKQLDKISGECEECALPDAPTVEVGPDGLLRTITPTRFEPTTTTITADRPRYAPAGAGARIGREQYITWATRAAPRDELLQGYTNPLAVPPANAPIEGIPTELVTTVTPNLTEIYARMMETIGNAGNAGAQAAEPAVRNTIEPGDPIEFLDDDDDVDGDYDEDGNDREEED